MDKYPHGVLPEDGGIQTPDNVASFIDGLYTSFRGLTTGPFVVYGDVQTDCYHAVLGNGGKLNALYSGMLQPQMEEFGTVWNGFYGAISSANYIIENIERLQNSEDMDEEDLAQLNGYMGTAQFFRAYCYYELAQKFCKAYDKTSAELAHSGIPISLKYNPTSINTTYLSRNTLEEVYTQILKDLEGAEKLLKEYGPRPDDGIWADAPYFTINAVNAMRARVALSMKDYEKAFNLSKALISSRNYTLSKSQNDITAMWAKDTGREAIMRVHMTWQFLGFPTGEYFKAPLGTNAAFIPTNEAVRLYSNNDKRYSAYMTNEILAIENTNITVVGMNKYPGNPVLYTSSNNFVNMSKPFHIAEQYLIAAEAAAELGDAASANDYLNMLRANRMDDYTNEYYSGQELINNIRVERQRELFGEGFRLGDLKRWGIGFTRSVAQNSSVVNQLGNIDRTSYEADDYRFVWPIPKGEMDANPQLKGQQNPGY
jgi:SusD family.